MINLLLVSGLLFNFLSTQDCSTFEERICNHKEEINISTFDINTLQWLSNNEYLYYGDYAIQNEYHSYISAIKIHFPDINSSSVLSSTLTLYAPYGGGSLNVGFCKRLDFNNDNPEYKDTEYSTSYDMQGNHYSIDVKEVVKSYLNAGFKHAYMLIKSNFPGAGGKLFGESDSKTYMPKFYLKINENPSITGITLKAPAYYHFDYNNPGLMSTVNCLGYALGLFKNCHISISEPSFVQTPKDFLTEIVPYVQNEILLKFNFYTRIIDSYNSPVFSHEYRIAFRINLATNSYHFMREAIDGYWCHKPSFSQNSNAFPVNENPDTIEWGPYNSDVIYFAVWR